MQYDGLLTLKMGPIGCPEKSERNYHCSVRNNLEGRSSHTLRPGSLKSCIILLKCLIVKEQKVSITILSRIRPCGLMWFQTISSVRSLKVFSIKAYLYTQCKW
jgi:hypothetical protein